LPQADPNPRYPDRLAAKPTTGEVVAAVTSVAEEPPPTLGHQVEREEADRGSLHHRAAAQPALGMRRGDGLPAHPGGAMLTAPAGRSRGRAMVVPGL